MIGLVVMSTLLSAPARKPIASCNKKTLDREHAQIANCFLDDSDEKLYYQKTAHILFHYYSSLDRGNGGVATPSAPVPVGSHKVTAGMKQRSMLDFITVQDSPEPNSESDDVYGDPPAAEAQLSMSKYSRMSRAELLESYMSKVSKEYTPEPDKADPRYMRKNIADGDCWYCEGTERVLVPNEGYIHCLICDTIEYVTIDSERPSYRDPPRELSYLCYKRSNHLQEWLSQTQGREYTNIPDHVYDSIMIELKKQKITNLALLERKKLKDVLKKLGYNKYFEHLNYIYTIITGKPSIRIPPEIEAQFKRMFAQIQVPFIKHAPPNRKNHLSYSFAISRFADLLGYDDIQEFLPQLKSKSKRDEQNRLWAAICNELNWEFRPQ